MSTNYEASAATQGKAEYVLAGNSDATELFNQRTLTHDAALVVPHLRPGMRLVDFGCGAGSLTCGFAGLVAPGEVLGFDLSVDGIAQASALAERSGLRNVRFSVANITKLDLPAESFDVAHFSGVLMYLNDPGTALKRAFHSLKPGGLLVAREAQKQGDWFGGPKAESIALFFSVAREAQRAAGGDPFLGRRLLGLVREAGFERLVAVPSYSAALSRIKASAAIMLSFCSRPEFRVLALQRGIAPERYDRLADDIAIWADSDDSVAAFAECTVIGWKP